MVVPQTAKKSTRQHILTIEFNGSDSYSPCLAVLHQHEHKSMH